MEKLRNIFVTILQNTEFYSKTYFVGGVVRDHLLGINSEDLDIVVEIDDGGLKLAEYLYEKGHTSQPVIFKRFSTASSLMDGYKVEFVMTRKESYLPHNRKPEVGVATIEEDVHRRDFTINTLLLKLDTGEILDLTGKGISDLESRIIRATTDPEILFREDPLRMLRAIRFAVQLDFEIEENTANWIKKKAVSIEDISIERIRDEMQKILLSSDPVRGIKLLLDYGFLKLIIPELIPTLNLEQNKYHIHDVFDHTMQVLSNVKPELHLRLAALLHDIGKPATASHDETGIHFYEHENVGSDISGKILNRLKFPIKTRRLVQQMVASHMKLKQAGDYGEMISDKSLRRLILFWGDELEYLLDLIHADNLAHAPEFVLAEQIPQIKVRIKALKKDLTKEKMPIKGKDVIEYFNLKPGHVIGEYLDRSLEIWLEHPNWDKARILKHIKNSGGKMAEESKVTQKVKEGVIKAYEVGEDVVEVVGKITKEIISTAKDEELSSKEKVNKLAHEALEGAKQGIKSAQPPTEEFVKKASKSIVEAIKVAAPKVSHFAHEAFKGIYEGAKDVYTAKKEDKED